MPFRYATFAAFLIAAFHLAPSAGSACRIPLRPEALRTVEADAIVLARVTSVEPTDDGWTATAEIRGNLVGSGPADSFTFSIGPVVSCYQMREPEPGRYYVLYLGRSEQGYQFRNGYPFWFARASEDPRLAALDELMPLGAARPPTRDESRLIDLAEPRAAAEAGISDLSGYTRIYARSSATLVRAMLFRSRTPERLVVEDHEELPTRESCDCDPISLTVNLQDLWEAGVLPPFNR